MKTKSTERETPLAQERRGVTGCTHDGTAGRRRHASERPTMGGARILSLAEWEKLVRGGYGAEFSKGTFVFNSRRLSVSRRAEEVY